MKKVYLFLATGFQETEAVACVTICRRTKIDIQTVSVMRTYMVESASGMMIKADKLLDECDFSDADMLVMPGGVPGSTNLRDCKPLQDVIMKHYKAGKALAAICGGPIVYGSLGILSGVNVTCYPGFEKELIGAIPTGKPIEIDGRFITGHGPGTSLNFGFAIVEYLMGKDEVERIKTQMMWPY